MTRNLGQTWPATRKSVVGRGQAFPFFCFLVLTLLLSGAALATDEESAWPREIKTDKALVVLYQPQVDSLVRDELSARAAVSVTLAGKEEPIFGAAWIEAHILTDLDTRTVTLREVRVPRVRFTEASDEHQQELVDLLTAEIPLWNIEISLDRLSAMLEIAERETRASEGFDDTPPKILFRQEPTVLVTIDGEPKLRDLEKTGLEHVVNTAFLIVQYPKSKGPFYLYGGNGNWYEAGAVKGPWKSTKNVPKEIRKLEPEDEEIDDEEAAEGPDTPPAIVVATVATEILVTEGEPEYTPIGDGELLVVSNTESDILREIATQRIFVLLSGRWFAASSAEGPWEMLPADELPESFAKIPPDSDQGYLLTWVAGTELAEEAALDAYIPQTAAVKRDATITVTYDGKPKFEEIEDTSLLYAVNTASQVIRDGEVYYCVEEAVWYQAHAAEGPWRVATEVPEEIQAIPPSSPVYNTKYVEIYDSTPEVVYEGYYPGYNHSYLYHGSLVYGTGWYYRPWLGSHYYPRYHTWGFSVRWNPWYGWGLGFGFSAGPFTFGFGWGGWYGGGWWGPRGYGGYRRGYHRGWHRGYRHGARAGYRGGYRAGRRDTGRNHYRNGNNRSRVARTSDIRGSGRSPGASTGRANNVFADKNGNVHRRQSNGNWQSRDGNNWRDSSVGDSARTRGDAASGQRTPRTADSKRPSNTSPERRSSTSTRPSSSSSRNSGSSLSRDHSARQRGTQRTQSHRSSGSMSRGGGSRGGSRGGGGRRR